MTKAYHITITDHAAPTAQEDWVWTLQQLLEYEKMDRAFPPGEEDDDTSYEITILDEAGRAEARAAQAEHEGVGQPPEGSEPIYYLSDDCSFHFSDTYWRTPDGRSWNMEGDGLQAEFEAERSNQAE